MTEKNWHFCELGYSNSTLPIAELFDFFSLIDRKVRFHFKRQPFKQSTWFFSSLALRLIVMIYFSIWIAYPEDLHWPGFWQCFPLDLIQSEFLQTCSGISASNHPTLLKRIFWTSSNHLFEMRNSANYRTVSWRDQFCAVASLSKHARKPIASLRNCAPHCGIPFTWASYGDITGLLINVTTQ